MIASGLRALLYGLRLTPLHPQWFSYRRERDRVAEASSLAVGAVLDIGCAGKIHQYQLAPGCTYTGLDTLTTGKELYRSTPDIYGDAHNLPLADGSFDTVMLMEVAEHLSAPDLAISEARRVLKPGGRLILTVPFLYPIHDAPHDYQRWTGHGLNVLARGAGFNVAHLVPQGTPVETGALMFNLGLSFHTLNALNRRSPMALILIPLVILLVPLCNVLGWICSRSRSPTSSPMSIGYLMLLTTQKHARL